MDPFGVPLHQTGKHMLFPGLDGRWKLGGSVNEASPSCPRCASPNTKFCYYNNYSLTQPRYFCKSCRRYWTKGGSLRNVPVGGGCRKNRRSRAARANLCSGNSKHSNNSASVSSDDLDEHDRVSGNSSGPANIDMAAVFARFLNQNPGSDASESDQFHFNVEGDSPSNDIEFDPMFSQPPNDIDSMMFLPQQSNGVENNPVYSEETAEDFVDGNDLDILGLFPSVLDDGDLSRPPMPDDGLWIDTESSPFLHSTWQLHETLPSASTDHNWNINSSTGTNLMVTGDNWNSTFDFSGLEVLSRPY